MLEYYLPSSDLYFTGPGKNSTFVVNCIFKNLQRIICRFFKAVSCSNHPFFVNEASAAEESRD
jgi:hypothetical protein